MSAEYVARQLALIEALEHSNRMKDRAAVLRIVGVQSGLCAALVRIADALASTGQFTELVDSGVSQ